MDLALALGAESAGLQYSTVIDGVTYRALQVDSQGRVVLGDSGQYLLLAGRAGGQAPKGGVAASENLTLESTAHASKGQVQVVDGSAFAMRKMYGNYVGQAGGDPGVMLRVRNQADAESVSAGKTGVSIDPTWAPSADAKTYTGLAGYAIVDNTGRANTNAHGLDFALAVWAGAFTNLIGAQVRPGKPTSYATTIANFEGVRVQPSISANAAITQYASFRSFTEGNSGIVTAIGLKIDDISLGTNKYLIEVGPSTPNLRVKAGTPPPGGADRETTHIYVAAVNSAGVVTLRQLHNVPLGSVGAAERVVIAQ